MAKKSKRKAAAPARVSVVGGPAGRVSTSRAPHPALQDQFPNRVYVNHEGSASGQAPYDDLVVEAELPDVPSGRFVAVYQLVEVRTLRVTRKLE